MANVFTYTYNVPHSYTAEKYSKHDDYTKALNHTLATLNFNENTS